jgi:lipopolysaccharide/colanic/teichoic acid biosynthesis glycosyltransferase
MASSIMASPVPDVAAVASCPAVQPAPDAEMVVAVTPVMRPVALPLMGLGVLLTAITSRGPVFFSQTRTGLRGKPFQLYKIRTLKVGTSDPNAGMHKNDPSVEYFGHFLRRWRIDELPQIWNILKGEMSWVGPRPERPELIEAHYGSLPHYHRRHEALPGITGWAQVHRPDATPDEAALKLPYDLAYVEEATLGMDLQILVRTVTAMG